MLYQSQLFLMALLLVQLAIMPTYAFPSNPLPPSGTNSSGLNETAAPHPHPSHRPPNGRFREQITHQGDGTYYAPGLGSCGQQSGNADLVVAISHVLYDGYGGDDAAGNGLCGKSIRASYGANSIVVTVVDRCEGCSSDDLDFSPAAFRKLSSLGSGRLRGIRWSFA